MSRPVTPPSPVPEDAAPDDDPYARLERIFHEPSRLAIVSVLCREADGVAFGELKKELGLTDGNLSRHIHALEEAGIVHQDKRFVGVRPRTTIFLTDRGLDQFTAYLEALEQVLARATQAVAPERKARIATFSTRKPARA